jgi:hypothetical protein
MADKFGIGMLAMALIALAVAAPSVMAQNNSESAQPPPAEAPPVQAPPAVPTPPVPAPPAQGGNVPAAPSSGGVGSPSVTVLNTQDVQGILGREVRSAADEDMGRIVDVIVDGDGRVRAAIIDFGGFLGVGSRKIAVDWKALHFVPTASRPHGIVLELTRDQVKPAPEYKDGKPVVVLGPSGNLEPFP